MEKINTSQETNKALVPSLEIGPVRYSFLEEARQLPLVIQPEERMFELRTWAQEYKQALTALLQNYGALLFRGFANNNLDSFEQFIHAISTERLAYNERSSPRTLVRSTIYTSIEYPASESIFLHNENSYQKTWPLKLFFYCQNPAEKGGETPIADCRRIYKALDPEVLETFRQKQVMDVRNFGSGFELPWEAVFQTKEKAQVEEYCKQAGIDFEWNGNKLRTRQVRPAIARHPQTSVYSWFNHAAFFHIITLDLVIQKVLLANFKEEGLPNNTYYGDGSIIPTPVLDHIRSVYRQETVSFPWQKDDILLIDNMSVAHRRNPFVGNRKVLIAMAEPGSAHGLNT